jgi:osmotically-inducible protein OsmY
VENLSQLKIVTMKTNEELQKNVQNALKWESLLNAAEIGVSVKDGIVTLTGNVNSYSKKSEAEEAAKNVAGVKVVVEEIKVRFDNTLAKKDDKDRKSVV